MTCKPICKFIVFLASAYFLGCATSEEQYIPSPPVGPNSQFVIVPTQAADTKPGVRRVSEKKKAASQESPTTEQDAPKVPESTETRLGETLIDLETEAMTNNPTLRRMQHEAAAEWAKVGYVSKLPDPTVSSTVFVPPMMFDPDRQLADVQVMQMIPWLDRLRAEGQKACMEALVAETQYQAERVKVIGEIRATWFKLYVLHKQIETTEADQEQIESLIKTANARIQTGNAQPGDVLMATLELSSLQEQLLSYRQQLIASTAELNRLVGRDASISVAAPTKIEASLPEWNHEWLREIAIENQPELNAARLRTAATRWGIEVARLKRRPDLSFGLGWVFMDAPGAMEPDAGRDSLTLGFSASLPIWDQKYDAMISEASSEHMAAHASEEEIALRLDALLLDLWEQARANQQTVELYEKTILPQARQTFEADQKSLVNNTVTFDRVIRDYRTLLNLELGYHKALGQLATTLARIHQAVGVDLPESVEKPSQE